MKDAGPSAPSGYTRLVVRDATVIARHDAVAGVEEALRETRTLHCWAATVPGAKPFQGRATAWGTTLPRGGPAVVVRHARHGGIFAAITGDRFLWPGRAPWELEASERLRAAGVPTPAVVAYALYPAGPGFCRCDVATARLPDGGDLPVVWATASVGDRDAMLTAVAALVRALGLVHAQHEDLNAKNVYLTREGAGFRAFALDVDRVRFLAPGDARATSLNLARLLRSLRKLRERAGLDIDDEALAQLERRTLNRPSAEGAA
ncbi:MAG TPA: lipopolysaccharide kinase InaA family protein [Gemmatimonadaceae bacterium]|nr:lipopolysaccharide kinase InaA family protein [Gemmatimonadaceae bacterium]